MNGQRFDETIRHSAFAAATMKLSTEIKAITFDVGGTLIEPWPSVGHVYAEVASRQGISGADPELLNRRFAEAWRAKANFDYSRSAWAAIVRHTFENPITSGQEPAFFAELYGRFAGPEVWRIYDDVAATLEPLSQRGIKLAVISNWDERLRPLLRGLKLDHFFEIVIVSSELGRHKPAPEIFEHALRQLGLPGPAVLHVGDSPLEDVTGAERAGLRAVRLNRRGPEQAPGEIRSLTELLVGVK